MVQALCLENYRYCKDRLNHFNKPHKDPDKFGTALLGGMRPYPMKMFRRRRFFNRSKYSMHETGGILGVRGIVYDP